jgi:hypothetical protein
MQVTTQHRPAPGRLAQLDDQLRRQVLILTAELDRQVERLRRALQLPEEPEAQGQWLKFSVDTRRMCPSLMALRPLSCAFSLAWIAVLWIVVPWMAKITGWCERLAADLPPPEPADDDKERFWTPDALLWAGLLLASALVFAPT